MKYRIVLVLCAMLALAGCSALMSSSGSAGYSGNSANNEVSASGSSSRGSYRPTATDISRYGDDVSAYLKALVSNFNAYRNAAVIVNDKVVPGLSSVKLSEVSSITLFDKAPVLKSSEKATHGAIVITTK
jgi:uncharacterized protein YceK